MAAMLVPTRMGFAVRPMVSGAGFECVADMTPDQHGGTRVLNACGEFKASIWSRHPAHPAWQKVHTLFGTEFQAYTAWGNLSCQIQQIVFKGATDPARLVATAGKLFNDVVEELPMTPLLHLVVLQTPVNRSLFVKAGCLLDHQLDAHAPWAIIGSRCEELCNVVPFSISDWAAASRVLEFPADVDTPSTATVSVTRKGILTLRLTWVKGIPWTDNAPLVRIAETIARFVRDLV